MSQAQRHALVMRQHLEHLSEEPLIRISVTGLRRCRMRQLAARGA